MAGHGFDWHAVKILYHNIKRGMRETRRKFSTGLD